METQTVTKSPSRLRGILLRAEFATFLGLVAIYVFFVLTTVSSFESLAGISSWADPAAELGIVAVPVGLLMIAGELDLSVGSVIGGSSMLLALLVGYLHWNMWIGVVACLALGAGTGFVNGVIVTRTALPSFIVTLGTYLALSGLTLGFSVLITGASSIDLTATHLAHLIFASQYKGFNISIVWWLATAVVGHHILTHTRIGNWITAVGGDLETANRAGVRSTRLRISLFVMTSMGAALVGIIQAIEYNGSQAANGQSYVFNSIIAVVIGGVLLTGGYGSIIGVVFGTLTYQIVTQGIYFTGWDTDWSNVIIGVLLLIAVLSNNLFRKIALARGVQKEPSHD